MSNINTEPQLTTPITPGSSTELIVYQLGELKTLMTGMGGKFESYTRDTDKRLNDLERFQATQMERDSVQPKLDPQKIILALISLISSIIAIALGFYHFH